MTEIWKTIPSFSSYEASDDGRIRRVRPTTKGVVGKLPRLMTQSRSKKGYLRVVINDDEGNAKHQYVHRLVLLAHVGPPKDEQECCHSNGRKTDNRLSNLRWGSSSDNTADAIKHGTYNPPWKRRWWSKKSLSIGGTT